MLPSTDASGRSRGTSGKNSWTGSTHATKKDDKMDFIGIKYGLNEDMNVFDIFTGHSKLIEEIFIGVFDQIELSAVVVLPSLIPALFSLVLMNMRQLKSKMGLV